jgi:pseudouridine-5'-phosphate glycosidase
MAMRPRVSAGGSERTSGGERATVWRMEIRVGRQVASALAAGQPAVALESTLIAHGLPRPRNLDVAERIEHVAHSEGAEPATIAVLDGVVHVGLDADQLKRVAGDASVVKLSERDLPVAAAKRLDGATTVAATATLAHRAGIDVFATGGLGGVHRGASQTWDVSADLPTLARTPIILVCAGVKSILDVAATLEQLETLGVTVVGYRTDRFAGFYRSDSGQPVPWTVDDADEIVAIHRARTDLGLQSALVVANPVPVDEQLDPELHDHALATGLEQAQASGISGGALTPFLLAHFHAATGGRSLEVNIRLVLHNVALAARIAGALAHA